MLEEHHPFFKIFFLCICLNPLNYFVNLLFHDNCIFKHLIQDWVTWYIKSCDSLHFFFLIMYDFVAPLRIRLHLYIWHPVDSSICWSRLVWWFVSTVTLLCHSYKENGLLINLYLCMSIIWTSAGVTLLNWCLLC